MNKNTLFFIIILIRWLPITAQNDYLVKTKNIPESNLFSIEEKIIAENFPLYKLCDWQTGMKFMCVPEKLDMIIATFKNYDTHKEINNSDLQYKIMEFAGMESNEKSIRFVFQTEEQKYYYEIKANNLEQYCQENPQVSIPTLAYLADVDTARKILIGQTLYTRTPTVKIDDANTYTGYREKKLPPNTKIYITDIGVGNKTCPVKIIFQDENGNSYYLALAFSKTNSGLDTRNFVANRLYDYFPHALSFSDANVAEAEKLSEQYKEKAIYPQTDVNMLSSGGTEVLIPRYTPLEIVGITAKENPIVVLKVKDTWGNNYTIEVTFKNNLLFQEENHFNTLFVLEDIRKKYPGIRETEWELISRGEVKNGMTKDMCRLAFGEPVLIRKKGNNKEFEDWIYPERVLSFTDGKLNMENQ